MPATHDDAICLRHREWSETSQTVTLFTREHGLVHGIAKGSYREKAPFSGGFEHLQFGEIGFINKPDRDLAILTDWDLANPFPGLRADFRAATLAMFAAETTAGLLAPLDPHPVLFSAFHRFLLAATGTAPSRSLARYFVSLLEETGHAVAAPETPTAPNEIWAYDPAGGQFSPDPDRARLPLEPFEAGHSRGGVWHVRGETINRLASLASDTENQLPAEENQSPSWTRVCRFLGACACYRASRRPASLEAFLRITRMKGAFPGSP